MIVLVGELNPYGSPPRFALYPWPRQASGNRLRRILGLTDRDYMALARHNLCEGRWSAPWARQMAATLLTTHRAPGTALVLLGGKVRAAFGQAHMGFLTSRCFDATEDRHLIVLPHPSGRNRMWNRPGAISRARELIQAVAPDLPLGTARDAYAED